MTWSVWGPLVDFSYFSEAVCGRSLLADGRGELETVLLPVWSSGQRPDHEGSLHHGETPDHRHLHNDYFPQALYQ